MFFIRTAPIFSILASILFVANSAQSSAFGFSDLALPPEWVQVRTGAPNVFMALQPGLSTESSDSSYAAVQSHAMSAKLIQFREDLKSGKIGPRSKFGKLEVQKLLNEKNCY